MNVWAGSQRLALEGTAPIGKLSIGKEIEVSIEGKTWTVRITELRDENGYVWWHAESTR